VAPEQRRQLFEEADAVAKALQELGFRHVTLDLLGYRLGSMNPVGPGADETDSCDATEFRGRLPTDPVGYRWGHWSSSRREVGSR